MRRITPILAVTLSLLLIGCAARTPPAWELADAQPIARGDDNLSAVLASADGHQPRGRRQTGHVTAVSARRPDLPNGALQLPRVSPDGRWVAFLDQPSDGPLASADGLITGRGMEHVSLWLREVEAKGVARNIALGGACWPTWSTDSRRLYFITHDPQLGCTLGIHDVAANATYRKAAGLRHMMMPAPSPDERYVAVAAFGEVPDDAVIFLIDLQTNQPSPGPPQRFGPQIYPRWIDRTTLLYIELSENGARLMRWARGDADSHEIARLNAPASVFDAQHMLTPIVNPLAPDLSSFAYYDAAEDRITLTHLADEQHQRLAKGERSGAWWGGDWFIAASDEQVELVAQHDPPPPPDHSSSNASQPPMTLRLLPGRWAPLWADRDRQSILLVGQSDRPDRFILLQVWLVADREGDR